ncbi:hypothetical protein SDJN02_24749 [Cucurbita argyrosperma subsp. argyrosperma]|nr:hypothetical protein SDJN02_24749 [Cucurbita argyrosperma subsp. argyrosperma]
MSVLCICLILRFVNSKFSFLSIAPIMLWPILYSYTDNCPIRQFMTDITKFISGCMASLSAMVQLELPHINILSKMDLVTNKKDIDDFLNPEPQVLLSELNQRMAPQFSKLNKALIELVDDYNMVSFVPLDLRKESSIKYVLAQIDNCIQYGEDADVKIKDFDPEDDD